MNSCEEPSEDTEQELDISVNISYEDPRYQTLVLQGPFGAVGYNIDISTGDLQRTCICAAWFDYECCCGYKYEKSNDEYY